MMDQRFWAIALLIAGLFTSPAAVAGPLEACQDQCRGQHTELSRAQCMERCQYDQKNCQAQQGAHCDGTDFHGANLAGRDLRGAVFRWVNLAGANLAGADMRGVRLIESNVTGANLAEANLTMAFIMDGSSLAGADMAGVRMRGIWFVNSTLSGARLAGADLFSARLLDSNLEGVDLTGARLAGADFQGSSLSGAVWPDGRRCGAGSVGECR